MLYADRIRQQIQVLGNVPMPSNEAIEHSEQLYLQLIDQLGDRSDNQPLPFVEVMEQLLHSPGLGYYSAGALKIGAAGDFVTAPEISAFYGFALANQCAEVLKVTSGSILEFGAGLGTLAKDVLVQLEKLQCLPEHYYIVEISADLKQRQQIKLQAEIPHLFPLISWLDQLPDEGFKGVILANEVIDAMPVHLFEMTANGPKDVGVVKAVDGELEFQTSTELSNEMAQWFARDEIQQLHFPEGYISEVNLIMESWIKALGDCLSQGLILLIDYGYPRHEYYLEERNQGSLICHYRHHSHDKVLYLAGLQDITAHVDFTAVAEAAFESGLSVSGYTNQASFLSGCGILQLAEAAAADDLDKQMQIAQQIRTLIMPDEMGEMFKIIALTQDLPLELTSHLQGFSLSDLRHAL
ncbi:MAG: SAM-dependent methyltransferase [Gammaproteobacteria bacterium]|nr:MAG: SAM-dependent methyltransferase [Gammaproteobacteria bacterium]